ncbi:MAG: hypothetical protein KAX19_05310 [Candidatus Brocadiae bacterium]|nr:hypothetical protein [Candidatus Brocadiia bacterium]
MTFVDRFADMLRTRLARHAASFPLTTAQGFCLLWSLGFAASRSHLTYARRHGRLQDVPRDGAGRMVWGIESVVEFALELERARAWLPGAHNAKKTPHERDAEVEAYQLAAESLPEWHELTPDELLNDLAQEDDLSIRHALWGQLCERFPSGPEGEAQVRPLCRLLPLLVDAEDREVREALAAKIREGGFLDAVRNGS